MRTGKILLNEAGGLSIVVIVTLSLIGSLGLLAVKGPEALDKYNSSLRRIRDGSPTNEDMNYTKDSLESLADGVGGLPIPTGPEDVISIAATSQMASMVEMASRPIPDRRQGFGRAGQSIACGITVSKTLAQPGEFVTASITIPVPFQNNLSRIVGEAGGSGFGLSRTGGTHTFQMPPDEALPVTVSFDALDRNGDTACSGAVTVQVDIPSSMYWVAGYTKPDGPFMADPFSMLKDEFVPTANTVILGQGLSRSKAIEAACYAFEWFSNWNMCCCSYYGQHSGYKVCLSHDYSNSEDYYWNTCNMIEKN